MGFVVSHRAVLMCCDFWLLVVSRPAGWVDDLCSHVLLQPRRPRLWCLWPDAFRTSCCCSSFANSRGWCMPKKLRVRTHFGRTSPHDLVSLQQQGPDSRLQTPAPATWLASGYLQVANTRPTVRTTM